MSTKWSTSDKGLGQICCCQGQAPPFSLTRKICPGEPLSMIICLNFLVTNISMLIRLVLCDLNCWIIKSQPGDDIAVIEKRVDNSATDNCSTTA